ncbi:MAG: TolC family protein [Acidobacteria bacterium]|nr:TolC family protein [Acidobacteriota bacterium]
MGTVPCLVLVLAIALTATPAVAQPAGPITIGDAIAAAVSAHPGTAEATARAEAAAEAVDLARAAYLPKLDAMWQVTRATRNNVFGAFFPQNVIPISGPVLGTDSFESAWGSATSLVFSAEVFDFGRRSAQVREARAGRDAAAAHADAVRLSAGVRAADLFLTVAGTAKVVEADTTTVARLEQLQRAVGALVSADLRPGADRARVDADLAAARGRLYANEQSLEVARIRLAVAMGQAGASPAVNAAPLLAASPGGLAADAAPVDVATHPTVREGAAQAQAAAAARDAARLAWRPTLLVQGALSARGSGALLDGAIDNGAGLWPDVPNWTAGVSMTFPLFDFGATRARVAQRGSFVIAADARQRALTDEATGAAREARVMAEAARRIAGTVPMRLTAARDAAAQARARYDAGLTGIVDVVEAERVLAQAESEAALAALALWRARLAQAAAAGDLAPFVADAAAPTGPPVVR